MDCQAKAVELKAFLLKIYRCKKDFELFVIDKKPKTRAGVYIVSKQRIRVYAKWRCCMSLREIAIHEYAPSIFFIDLLIASSIEGEFNLSLTIW
jgi:hypothetical protein